jgi:hypothetical protein
MGASPMPIGAYLLFVNAPPQRVLQSFVFIRLHLGPDVFNVKNREMVENLNITERERNEKKIEFWRKT